MRPPTHILLFLSLVPAALALPSLAPPSEHPLQNPLFPHFAPISTRPDALTHAAAYADEKVWRLRLLDQARGRMEEVHGVAEDMNLDIWRATPNTMDIRLNDRQAQSLQRKLGEGVVFEPFITELQSLVALSAPADIQLDTESPVTEGESDSDFDFLIKKKKPKKGKSPKVDPFNLTTLATPFHDHYHTLEDIHKFGSALIQTFAGQEGIKVWEFDIGETWEGRAIKGWSAKIENVESELATQKRKWKVGDEGDEELGREIVIMSGQHGREWVGPSSALYFLHHLLHTAQASPSGESALFLRHFTFTIIPVMNPDGFVYSQSHRMWRKNRQAVGDKRCVGIDLNSNWGYKWSGQKKNDPCSESFPGSGAFQAWETKAMNEWLGKSTERGVRVRGFVDLHSYGQLFMFPYAHSCSDFPIDAEMLMEAGLGVAKAIRTTHGQPYEAGQACDLTYRAPGDAVDYVYGVTDVRWSYSAELRDTGTYGFMLPKELIRPTAEEITAGLSHLAKFIYVAEIET